MRDLLELRSVIGKAVIESLNYFDYEDTVSHMKTAREILDSAEGAYRRYFADPIFHARVTRMVCHIMQSIRERPSTQEPTP